MLDNYFIQLKALKEEKELLQSQLKELNAQEEYLEQIIIEQMMQEGVQKATVEGVGTASIKRTLYPAIKDWDTMLEYMKQMDDFSILKHGVNAATWRERLGSGEDVPGVESFEKNILLFRKK